MGKSRKKLVEGCDKALQAMKYELAAEIGLIAPVSYDMNSEFADELGHNSQSAHQSIDWGSVSSRQNGYIGGSITKRLVAQAQNSIKN